MPIIPGYFNRYEQVEVSASNFSRILLNSDYPDFVQWNLADILKDPTVSFSKYGDSVIDRAHNVFQALRHHGQFGFDGWSEFINDAGPAALYAHTKNEYLMRRYRLNKPLLDYYEGIDPYILESLAPALGLTLEAMQVSLGFCQDLAKESFYDVKHWTRGYEGPMAFLGATTPINPDSASNGFYQYPDAIGSNFIKEGDTVTNRIPVGLYASPYKAAEYCIRQSMSYVAANLPNYSELGAHLFARNIFFEFDLLEAPNIAPVNTPGGKEIMIKTGRLFKVMRIEEAIIQGHTHTGLIVSLQELPQSGEPSSWKDFIDCQPYSHS